MLNIIKSLNYSARRDTVIWITILSLLVIPVFEMYVSGLLNSDSISKLTPSAYFVSQEMATVYMFMVLGMMIFSCKLVAGDAGDKTINYEFMAGHSRNKIFFGRIIAGFLWGTVLVYILSMLPLVYLNILYGWGPETDKTEVLLRCLLVIFPTIRTTSFYISIAIISRSAGKGIALNYAIYLFTSLAASLINEIFNIEITYPLGMTNAAFLLISENSRNVVINGKTVMVYDTGITGDMVLKTIVVSIIFTAIYLTVAFIDFKKKDRD